MTRLPAVLALFAALQDPGALQDPQSPAARLTAPAECRVKLETSKGDIVLRIAREWAPKGADRFYSLVMNGYYDGARFYRVMPKFVAQFGIHGDPKISMKWRGAPIEDDPVRQKNLRGRLSFAQSGPHSRTTNVFINLKDSTSLDSSGFAPFAEVVEGMEVADGLFSGYGDGAPKGRGPSQKRLYEEGNAWLEKEFKDLDFIRKARKLD